MESRIAGMLLQLASPRVGNEVRKLVRELTRVAGVRRVTPSTKFARLLRISFDSNVIQARTLVEYVRRDWAGARLI